MMPKPETLIHHTLNPTKTMPGLELCGTALRPLVRRVAPMSLGGEGTCGLWLTGLRVHIDIYMCI